MNKRWQNLRDLNVSIKISGDTMSHVFPDGVTIELVADPNMSSMEFFVKTVEFYDAISDYYLGREDESRH